MFQRLKPLTEAFPGQVVLSFSALIVFFFFSLGLTNNAIRKGGIFLPALVRWTLNGLLIGQNSYFLCVRFNNSKTAKIETNGIKEEEEY